MSTVSKIVPFPSIKSPTREGNSRRRSESHETELKEQDSVRTKLSPRNPNAPARIRLDRAINTTLNQLNQADDLLSRADRVLDDQITLANSLGSALSRGSRIRTQNLRANLLTLESRAQAVESEVAVLNQEIEQAGSATVVAGSTIKGTLQVPAIKFKAPIAEKIATAADAESLAVELTKSQLEVRKHKEELQELRKLAETLLNESRSELKDSGVSPDLSLGQAQSAAVVTAAAIRGSDDAQTVHRLLSDQVGRLIA